MSTGNQDHIIRKLVRRPSVVVALCIIGLTCIIAVFAYLLAPDNTPYANRMIVELGARKPGFTKQLLMIPKQIKQLRGSILNQTFSGTPSNYQALPINSYSFSGDRIIVRH